MDQSHHHHGFDPERLLEHESRRREWINPEEIMHDALVDGDRQMADVGCGVGFFALAAAPIIAPGTVWAVDVHPQMVSTTVERARSAGHDNVQGVVCDALQLPLAANSIDLVFMGTVLHDLSDPKQALAEARRVLARGGRLYLLEWAKSAKEEGPPIQIRFAESDLKALLEGANFEVQWMKSGPGPFYRALAWLPDDA